jgi:hypothetical protein
MIHCTGTSKVALDVLASVTSEYLLNVGRTIRYLRDKYSRSMTAEVRDSRYGRPANEVHN